MIEAGKCSCYHGFECTEGCTCNGCTHNDEEEVVPTCDICGDTDHEGEADWNGETGNHITCEQWESQPQ